MTKSLTAFQVETERAIAAAIAAHGHVLLDRALNGEHETYIVASVSRTELTIYIYENEAGVQGAGVDERFEAPDYGSAEELSRAFVDEVVTRLRQPSA
jgi:hypothetical protein